MIPNTTLDRIRQAVDIVAIIQPFVPLTRKGRNYVGLSPFQTEKTPSFTVSAEKGLYKCFSSGKGGDTFSFLMETQRMNFYDAVRYVAEQVGIEIEEKPGDGAARELEANAAAANEWAAGLFVEWREQAFWDWAKGRGLEPETLDAFRVGQAGSGWDDMQKRGTYRIETLLDAGLAKSSQTGRLYDAFRNRIMFPITDMFGKVVGFGGRKYLAEDEGPKYLNTGEARLYDKSRVLFGLAQAKDEIRKQDMAILVEGYTDVLSLYQAGIRNAVAPCGTALTAEQVRLIQRFGKQVTLALDDDLAGQKATLKHLSLLLGEGMLVKVAAIPEGHDPDSYTRDYGAPAMRAVLGGAQDWLQWAVAAIPRIRGWGQSPADKTRLIEAIDGLIRCIPWDVSQELHREEAAKLLGIPTYLVKSPEQVRNDAIDPNRRNWVWHQRIIPAGVVPSPDFSRTETGDLRVHYRDLMGKGYRMNVSGGGKQPVTRNLTRNERVQAVYIPPRMRSYFGKAHPPVAGVPLFLVQDEVTAWMMDLLGMFAIGLPSRDGFLFKPKSKKAHNLLRQVVGKGFRHIVYLASGEMFDLPAGKEGKNPYRSVDAGTIAREYVDIMLSLKEALGEVNVHLVHPRIDNAYLPHTEERWIEGMLLEVLCGGWPPHQAKGLASELYSELCRVIQPGAESDLLEAHNLTDNNLNYYQKVVRLHEPQAFYDFHGIIKLGDEFQLGRYLYVVDRDNQVSLQQNAEEHQIIQERDGAYWALTKSGPLKISDFLIHPVLKIRGLSPRVLVQIKTQFGKLYDLVLDPKLLLNADQFYLRVYGVAGCFFQGTNTHFRHLQQMVFERMPEAYLLDKLGHQEIRQAGGKISLYATGNGLVTYDEGFKPADERGLVDYAGETFFLPADSSFELDEDRDEMYETHKKFSYEAGEVTFEEWLRQYFEVHPREGAHVGFAFYLMSLYRDIVFKVAGVQPNCYFQGESGSGKSTLRKSLSRLFGEAPTILCTDNPTMASVGSLGLQVSNALVVLEEFNVFKLVNNKQDWIIDLAKAFYDGKSRTTRQSAQSEFLKNKMVKACLLTCGQEPFYTYDEAVNNRFLMVEFHPRDFNLDAYSQLKYMEDGGLFHITEQFLQHRRFIEEQYRTRMHDVERTLKRRLGERKVLERLVQNWAIVLTPLLMLIREGLIEYPLTVKEILDMATDSILAHANKAYKKGILGEFWAFIETAYGRKVDDRDIFVFQGTELRIRFRPVLNHFKEYIRALGDKTIEAPSESNLRRKLERHEAFLNETQTWMGFKRDPAGKIIYKKTTSDQLIPVYQKKQCMCFDLSKLGLSLTDVAAAGHVDEEDIEPEPKSAADNPTAQQEIPITLPPPQREYYDPT